MRTFGLVLTSAREGVQIQAETMQEAIAIAEKQYGGIVYGGFSISGPTELEGASR